MQLRGTETPTSIQRTTPSNNHLHRLLAQFNRRRLTPQLDAEAWSTSLEIETHVRRLEHEFVEREIEPIRGWAHDAPTDPDAFVRWFEHLTEVGPGQGDPLFPWLAETADYAQMHWFLRQEMAGEAGFDDLVAMTQVKFPVQAKLELARNYWDEMGRGTASGMHGPMLEQLAAALEPAREQTVWESLALSNLMVALAANRHYAYQSIGALGVIELTAPGRATLVNAGLKRLGFSGEARRYYALHATLDVKHSRAWNHEVLRPLIAAEPRTAYAIAEGALLRLRAGEQCFERYRAVLWDASPMQRQRSAV